MAAFIGGTETFKIMKGHRQEVYNEPLYYEIAFSFIDAKKQVDLFEEFIKEYSKIRVRRFLDIGCGPSLQLREIARRGYEAVGLDSSPRMLEYLEAKAKAEGTRIETVKTDMASFRLRKKADFAFIMMGTISCIDSNDKFLSHLNSVAGSLRKGGLYLIENFRLDWAGKRFLDSQSWTMERDGVQVKTTYSIKIREALSQMLTETVKLEVNDSGRQFVLEETTDTKMIFPQELPALVALNGEFEFIGWFERDRMQKLEKADMDNIIILRRK
jgi:SAM-dependent methyltransferase